MNLLRLFRRINDERDKMIQSMPEPAVWEFPKKKERDSDGYYPIVCPHCMMTFHIWEAEFRSPMTYLESGYNLENGQDQIVNNIKGFPGEIDDRYEYFETSKGSGLWGSHRGKVLKIFDEKGEPTGEVTHITLMDKQNGGTDINGTRIPIMERNARDFIKKPIMAVINKYGELCSERICPYCHHRVSDYVGIMPSYNVALIGDINSREALYLYNLGERISGSGLLGGSLLGHEINPDYRRWIRNTFEINQKNWKNLLSLYYDPVCITPPNIINFYQEQGGFILNLCCIDENFIANCYDNNGMEFRCYDIRTIRRHYELMCCRMDAFMLMFDAAHFETVRAVLESDEELKSYNNKTSKVQHPLKSLTFFEPEYLGEQRYVFSKPAAFIMSKSDLIKSAKEKNSDYFQNLTDREIFLYPNQKQDRDRTKVDLDDLYECDRAIERFLKESQEDSMLFSKIDQKNEEGCWFAVSSKGDAANGVADPVRITEPMEWILWRLGLVQGEGNAIPGGGNPIRVK